MKDSMMLLFLFCASGCKEDDSNAEILTPDIDSSPVIYASTDLTVTSIEVSSGTKLIGAVTDTSSSTYWSSDKHTNSHQLEWITYRFSDLQKINYIKLLPVYSNGSAINFPIKFEVYGFDVNGRKLIKAYNNFPVASRDWLILPIGTLNAEGIQIHATQLGKAGGSDFSFQLAEVTAGYDAGFNHFTFVENNSKVKQNEVRNIGSSTFDPGKLVNWNYDVRNPLITAVYGGNSNIYAPYIIENGAGWNVYFGGWDGTNDGHDRISLTTTNDNFLSFSSHQLMIDKGDMIHVNNEAVIRRPDGKWHMLYTTLASDPQINKPGYAVSDDGVNWNPSEGNVNYLLKMNGYDNWDIADVNGSNVPFYENGTYYFYFNDFNYASSGHAFAVHNAISTDLINMTYTGDVLDEALVAQDVKKFDVAGTQLYLMVLHRNGNELRYSIGSSPVNFAASKQLFTNQNAADRYIVSAGLVAKNNRLYGVLYGAGAVSSLDRNAINAKWLQKKVLFISDATDEQLGKQVKAYGPNRLIINMTKDLYTGKFYIYDTDGTTLIFTSPKVTIKSGDVWNYTP
jgi:hypothetical protein